MRQLKFVKDPDNRWYVELPEWQGNRADLEMVAGADNMLEHMAEGKNHVFLFVSENEFTGSDKLEMLRLATELENGAYYILRKYKGIELNLEMWLCDVTKFVFGDFPKEIFILAYKQI